jgi:hypothetical protein
MSFVITLEGELSMLRAVLARPSTLRLFTNDVTPTRGMTADDFQEASAGGYQPKSVRGPNWKIDRDRVGHLDRQTFEFTGPAGRIFGWFLTSDDDDAVLGAERLPNGPMDIFSNGDNIGFDVLFSLPATD